MPAVHRAATRFADAVGLASFGWRRRDRAAIFAYCLALPFALRLPRAWRSRLSFRFFVSLDGVGRAPVLLAASHEEYLTFREVFLEEEYGGARVDNPESVVDVGANIGLASVYLGLRYPDARIFAVEPNGALHSRLARHLAALGPRATAERVAIAGKDGDIEFGVCAEKPIASSAARAGEGFAVERVPAETWETFCARRKLGAVGLLKCDAEGGEHAILSSAAFSRVRAFVGEVHGDLMPEPWPAVRGRLVEAGSRVIEERAGKAERAIVRIYPPRPPLPAAPSVSVVIAAHNRARRVGDSVKSALAQPDVAEVVVIDDGSADGTAAAAREAGSGDPRLSVVTLPENAGASSARNEGVSRARGDLVLVWDSDDSLDSGAVAALLAEFARDPGLGVVAAPARFESRGSIETPRLVPGEISHGDVLCRGLNALEKVRLARRDLLLESPYRAANIDFLVNVELTERGRWRRVAEPLAIVRDTTAEGSLTALRRVPSVRKAVARAPHLAGFLARDGAAMRRRCPGAFAAFAYGASLANLLAGRRRYALRAAARGLGAVSSAKALTLAILAAVPGGAQVSRVVVRFVAWLRSW
jgi:FkbM family methyltransferase